MGPGFVPRTRWWCYFEGTFYSEITSFYSRERTVIFWLRYRAGPSQEGQLTWRVYFFAPHVCYKWGAQEILFFECGAPSVGFRRRLVLTYRRRVERWDRDTDKIESRLSHLDRHVKLFSWHIPVYALGYGNTTQDILYILNDWHCLLFRFQLVSRELFEELFKGVARKSAVWGPLINHNNPDPRRFWREKILKTDACEEERSHLTVAETGASSVRLMKSWRTLWDNREANAY